MYTQKISARDRKYVTNVRIVRCSLVKFGDDG